MSAQQGQGKYRSFAWGSVLRCTISWMDMEISKRKAVLKATKRRCKFYAAFVIFFLFSWFLFVVG